MKNRIVVIILSVLLLNTAFAQTVSPKKALKLSAAYVEAGKNREAVTLLSKYVDQESKYQSKIAVELAQSQAKILLLDSAMISLNIAAKADDEGTVAQVEHLKKQILDSIAAYNVEIALGKKYIMDRNFTEAQIAFTNAMAYDTGNYQAWFGLGEVAHLSSSLSQGIELYYKASEKYTPSIMEKAHVYEHISEAYIIQREFDQAVKICDSALAIAPQTVEADFWKAKALYLQRHFTDAQISATAYLDHELEDKLAWVLRGDCFFFEKLYASAISDFNEALILDADLVEVYNNRGISYFYLQKYDSAIADFEKLLSYNEGNFYAYNALGVVAYAQKNYKKAVANFEMATSLRAMDEYTYNLAVGYFKNNQLDLAIHHLDNLTRVNETQLKYNVLKAQVLIASKNYDKARSWIDRLTKANPYIKNYHLLSAEIYRLQGDEKSAEKSEKIAHHMKDIDLSLAPSF